MYGPLRPSNYRSAFDLREITLNLKGELNTIHIMLQIVNDIKYLIIGDLGCADDTPLD